MAIDDPEWLKFGVAATIAVVTLVTGFIQFGTASAFSVRRPFLQKQTEVCHLAAEHAARLASTRDPDIWAESREEFWMLYWGPLAMVEDVETTDNSVEKAMKAFGDKLKKIDPKPTLPVEALEQPALHIAHACRDLLGAKWNVGVLKWFRQGEMRVVG